ncbi:hypothetical protein F7725_018618 [Dissostichus mawsoni]|uniref:BTB domain-containing protein n=1 Tax=Dissostichus mawsoni TaxID=36200 RepID=A0A7J5XSQ0_DISMA|nr:hypothetical protein F7725_018618 [Dissostichus mawsoni]
MIRINNTQYFHFLQEADALRRSGSLCDVIISNTSAAASPGSHRQLSPLHSGVFLPSHLPASSDFTYTQTLEVTEGDLHLLLRAAQLLEMKLLEDQCLKQLGKLNYREVEADRREIPCFKEVEQDESAEKNGQKQSSSPVEEEKLKRLLPRGGGKRLHCHGEPLAL